jgi:hypothetical protein
MKRLLIVGGIAVVVGLATFFVARHFLRDKLLGDKEEQVVALRPHLLRHLALATDYLENPKNLQEYEVEGGMAHMTMKVFPPKEPAPQVPIPDDPVETTNRLRTKVAFMPSTLEVGDVDGATGKMTYEQVDNLIKEKVVPVEAGERVITPGKTPAGRVLVFDVHSARRLAQLLYCCGIYFKYFPTGSSENLPTDAELNSILGMMKTVDQYDADVEYNLGPQVLNFSLVAACLLGGLVFVLGLIFWRKRRVA